MSITKFRFIFDWRNPFGYFIAVIMEYICATNLLLIGTSMFTLTLGAPLLGYTVINDFKTYLNKIDKMGKLRKTHLQATEQFYDFVQLHTLMKQLSDFSIFINFLLIEVKFA